MHEWPTVFLNLASDYYAVQGIPTQWYKGSEAIIASDEKEENQHHPHSLAFFRNGARTEGKNALTIAECRR